MQVSPEARALEKAENDKLATIEVQKDVTSEQHLAILAKVTGLSQTSARSFLHGPNPANVYVSPLFYEQPLVSVCVGCQVFKEKEAFRWMAENELMLPVAYADYRLYSKDQIALLAGVKHVGRHATRLILDHARDVNHEDCFCADCMARDVKSLNRLPMALKDPAYSAIENLRGLPSNIQTTFTQAISLACMRKSKPLIVKLWTETNHARMLHEAQAFGAVPQLFARGAERNQEQVDPAFLAEQLAIAYNPAIPAMEYLQIIKENRCALSFLVSEETVNVERAISRVQKINEEVTYISGQKKSELMRVETSVTRQTLAATAEAVLGGLLGFVAAGPVGAAAGAAATPCLHQLGSMAARAIENQASKSGRVAASLFGTSSTAVQIWRLRRDLGQRV